MRVSAAGPGTRWFERRLDLGVRPEGDFVARVRELAPGALGGLAPPSATWSTDHADCLLVVDHPALPPRGRRAGIDTLQVNWSAGRLGGSWSTGALWDDAPRAADALVVKGFDLTDHDAAAAAVDWFAEQLSRPVDHEIRTLLDTAGGGRAIDVGGISRLVDKLSGRLRADRWVLADTGRTLVALGGVARVGAVRSRFRVHPRVPDDVVERAWAEVAQDCGCPDVYYCPSGGEVECPRHGGFDTCCAHPGAHRPLPSDLRCRDPRPSIDPADLLDDA